MRNLKYIGKGLTLTMFLLMGLVAANSTYASGVTEFKVDGLNVILKNSPKEVISVRLFVEGGVTNYSKDKEGIEGLAFSLAMTGGTNSMDKITFASAAEKIGTQFGSSTTYDFGTMSMTCVKMFWDKSWNLFTDAIMNPSFNEAEFKLLQEQLVAGAKSSMSDPDSHLRNLAMKNAFGGSAYEKIPDGTPESLESLTLNDVKKHYRSVLGKKRAFLVVVGNVDEKDLKAKIQKSLAKLPFGDLPKYEERQMITEPGTFIEDRDIATNYIRGLMSAPTMETKDGVAMRIAMSVLRDRYFLELRTKRSLSYAPAAFYSSGVLKNPYNVIYISTLDPKQSMDVMVAEINKIKKEGFLPGELRDAQQSFLTYYYMGQESTSAQTQTIGTAEIVGGWEMAENFTENVNAVTLKDLNRVFDKYTKAIKWTYLGKQDMVEKGNFMQTVETPEKNKPY